MKDSSMKLTTLILLVFGIFSHAFAYCDSIDSNILSYNLQILKSIEKNMNKYHKENKEKRIDTLAVLHNDMIQINTYLMNMTVLLNNIIENQKVGLKVENKPLALLYDNDKNEDKKSLKKLEEATVK